MKFIKLLKKYGKRLNAILGLIISSIILVPSALICIYPDLLTGNLRAWCTISLAFSSFLILLVWIMAANDTLKEIITQKGQFQRIYKTIDYTISISTFLLGIPSLFIIVSLMVSLTSSVYEFVDFVLSRGTTYTVVLLIYLSVCMLIYSSAYKLKNKRLPPMSSNGLDFLLLMFSSFGYLLASLESIQRISILQKLTESENIMFMFLFIVLFFICLALVILINTISDVIKEGTEVQHTFLFVASLIVLALSTLIIVYSFYVSDQSLFKSILFKIVRILFRIVRYVYASQCIVALFVFIRYFLTNLK